MLNKTINRTNKNKLNKIGLFCLSLSLLIFNANLEAAELIDNEIEFINKTDKTLEVQPIYKSNAKIIRQKNPIVLKSNRNSKGIINDEDNTLILTNQDFSALEGYKLGINKASVEKIDKNIDKLKRAAGYYNYTLDIPVKDIVKAAQIENQNQNKASKSVIISIEPDSKLVRFVRRKPFSIKISSENIKRQSANNNTNNSTTQSTTNKSVDNNSNNKASNITQPIRKSRSKNLLQEKLAAQYKLDKAQNTKVQSNTQNSTSTTDNDNNEDSTDFTDFLNKYY